ncbi:hypothetical protein BV22DRAFT_1119402 [Leucogyrophana mollusca]|uniref:Uncharacterized protein n=1 Tax=Leucogyrophana mollusca TaxID=85980 RepID=A0ACB8BK32_9AGAM|nr:hypothetical protein BV22DRAFT_1119402 [Leucogyrophana mollusca]
MLFFSFPYVSMALTLALYLASLSTEHHRKSGLPVEVVGNTTAFERSYIGGLTHYTVAEPTTAYDGTYKPGKYVVEISMLLCC